jgi:hypothetical protein
MVLQMAVLPCLSVEIRKNVGAANHFLSNHGSLWCYHKTLLSAQGLEKERFITGAGLKCGQTVTHGA